MIRLVHASDIQIPAFKRHNEFKSHFDNFYTSIKNKKPDYIVLAGDIVHQKTVLSPELVNMCVEFFDNLSQISQLRIIAGNHDQPLKALHRLDLLTPVIKALNKDNIKYYKYSGIYREDDLDFVVFSCLDEEDKWPKAQNINIDRINIGLYHGFIQGALLQNGMKVETKDCPYSIRKFLDVVDYLMLGDIHKVQFLDLYSKSAYCGSLIQQNYGEDIDKGYLLWDIESKYKHQVEFIELPNVCPFYTISLNDNLEIKSKLDLKQNSRIRIQCRKPTLTEKKQIQDKIISLYNPISLEIDDKDNSKAELILNEVDAKIEDLGEISVQEKLLKNFFEKDALNSDLMTSILEINKKYNDQIKKDDDILRNVQYSLGLMKWNNLFAYGEDNSFDFSKNKGVVGVFGKSGSGKSSFVDVPLYCLFNKISKKVSKNEHIINENADKGFASLDIYVKNKVYKIERNTNISIKSGKRQGKPVFQSKTDVIFKCFVNEQEEILNGEQRNDTDVAIRKIFGTAEDFMSTAIAPQWQLLNFIDSGATERQKLIGKYYDIDIFFKKNDLAKEYLKELRGKIKLYQSTSFDTLIPEARKNLQECVEQFKIESDRNNECSNSIKQLRNDLYDLEKRDKDRYEFTKLNEQLKKQNEISENFLKEKQKYNSEELFNFINNISSELEKYKDVQLHNIVFIKKNIDDNNKKLERLLKYECITNSNCCMKQESLKIQQENLYLKQEFIKLSELNKEKIELTNKLEKYRKSLDCFFEIKKGIELTESLKNDLLEKIKDLKFEDKNFDSQMNELRLNIINLEKQKGETQKNIISLASKKGALEQSLKEYIKQQQEFLQIKLEYDAYEYFTRAMSKDGIAKKIISDNLGIINYEIKKILSKGVNFNVSLESSEDGKAIDIYFESDKGNKRIIELCGGAEKTMASLAIRAALLNITTLPKPNILILDEALTAFDSEYMHDLQKILDFLKQIFECIIIITHDDILKDMVDYVIEVEKNSDGFSKILC